MPRDAHPQSQSLVWPPANTNYIRPKLELIEPISFQGRPLPARRWIVEGWIPCSVVTLLYGDGGLGKSLLGMQLATACAMGKQWLGMPVSACKALYVSCEDDADELNRRQAAINVLYGIEFGDLEHLTWCDRTGKVDNSLMKFARFDVEPPTPSEFFGQLQDAAEAFGAQLVVLDSLHDVFDGEENSRKHARQFIRLLTSLARDIDGAVVMLAHPSQDGLRSGNGTSGSTAWSNACRSRLYFRRPKDSDLDVDNEDVRVLRRMKSNYARSGDELTVRWREGAFLREFEPSGAVKAIEDGRMERIFLACLDAATTQGRALSEFPSAGNYAPKVMVAMPVAQRTKRTDLALAMSRLFAAGEIVVGETEIVGSDRHRKRGIIRANSPDGVRDGAGRPHASH